METANNVVDLAHRLPTCEEIESASGAATFLANERDESGGLVVQRQEGDVRLAPAICDLFIDLLSHIADGHMVKVIPTGIMLTTQEAADILNVSRPHLSKLLKEGAIPHVPVGSHRRVRHDDLMAYKAERDKGRSETLDKLATMGQEFDNG